MAMELVVRNTFIDFDNVDTDAPSSKRSTSVPRSWKPASCVLGAKTLWSDVSTVASDEPFVDQDVSSSGVSCSDSDGASSEHNEDASKAVLCLSSMISEEDKLRSTKLSAKARMFEPISSLTQDIRLVLTAAHASLKASPKLFNVHMSEGAFGGATTIIGSYAKGSLLAFELVKTLSIVRMALLDAAATSENTYVIGYARQPFLEIGQSGFSAKLSSVPTTQDDMTCWDTYQKGFCPRPSTCCWCHPADSEIVKVIVMLSEVEPIDEK